MAWKNPTRIRQIFETQPGVALWAVEQALTDKQFGQVEDTLVPPIGDDMEVAVKAAEAKLREQFPNDDETVESMLNGFRDSIAKAMEIKKEAEREIALNEPANDTVPLPK